MTTYAYLDKKTLEKLVEKEKESGKEQFVELHRMTVPLNKEEKAELTKRYIPQYTTGTRDTIHLNKLALEVNPTKQIIAPVIPSAKNMIKRKTELFGYYSATSILEEWGDSYTAMVRNIRQGNSAIKEAELNQVQENYCKKHNDALEDILTKAHDRQYAV